MKEVAGFCNEITLTDTASSMTKKSHIRNLVDSYRVGTGEESWVVDRLL